MQKVNVNSRTYDLAKRILDLVVSGVGLLVLAPLAVIIAVLIKLDSKGPVLFRQAALGLRERRFTLLKFRSMLPGSQDESHRADIVRNIRARTPTTFDANGQPIYKTALTEARRITRIGRVLRATSLDELPQLWNVFLGDMSLVGPRPALPWEAEFYDPTQRRRFDVKPGMTGLYQVTARNRVPVEEMIRIDIDYVRKRSFSMDIKLLVRTPAAMFRGM